MWTICRIPMITINNFAMSFQRILMVSMLLCLSSISVALSEFGHITLLDPRVGFRDITYVNQDGYAVTEGDIILLKLPKTEKTNNRMPHAMILLKLGGFRWPQAIVPYKFAPTISSHAQLAILNAMETWQRATRIRFVELSQVNQNKYSDYLLFIPTENDICSSAVGRQGGPQIILLGPKCETMKVAHELGHILGLWHEQSRNDRDQYIQIIWENIQENYRYNFNQHLNDGEDFGEYDYQSIMHYKADAWSKNGQDTIIPLQPGATIGHREHLSAKDIAAVNAMYP